MNYEKASVVRREKGQVACISGVQVYFAVPRMGGLNYLGTLIHYSRKPIIGTHMIMNLSTY